MLSGMLLSAKIHRSRAMCTLVNTSYRMPWTGKLTVTQGEGSVIHPKCRIIASPQCKISIGEQTIIEEGVNILSKDTLKPVKIGNHNLIEVNARKSLILLAKTMTRATDRYLV